MLKLLIAFLMIISTEKTHTVSIASLDLPDPVVYEITAYTLRPEETGGKHPGDPSYGITASGKRVKANHTAACGPELAFGTEIYIAELGNTFTCEDRGAAIGDGELDVYMPDLQDALEFGRQKLEVIVLDKP